MSDHHRFCHQKAWLACAMAESKATLSKERLPLPPAHQRAALADALWIAARGKQPPAVCQAECDRSKRCHSHCLVDDEHASRAEKLLAVTQRGADIRRCVQTVGRDKQVMLTLCKALKTRICVDIEQCVFDERKPCKACARTMQEDS
jgi:hypothetical protein